MNSRSEHILGSTRIFVAMPGELQFQQDHGIFVDSDTPLTRNGIHDAEWLAQEIKRRLDAAAAFTDSGDILLPRYSPALAISRIYSGTFLKSQQTAKRIADIIGASVEIVPALNEVDLGAWGDRNLFDTKASPSDELQRQSSSQDSIAPPDDEILSSASDRIAGAVDDILRQNQNRATMVVGGNISTFMILSHLINMPFQRCLRTMTQTSPCYNIVDILTDDTTVVVGLNQTKIGTDSR